MLWIIKKGNTTSARYKTNNILLPKINISQLETKILIWTTVNPKATKGFLYSLRKWEHISLLPSTKVFLQLETILLDIAPVFSFPCFYGGHPIRAHKTDTSLRRTLSHVLAELGCLSHWKTSYKTDNCKTGTSLRQTLSSVPISNFHCKLLLKTDTSHSNGDFYTKWSNFWLSSCKFHI